MAISLSDIDAGAVALAFDPADLDAIRAEINATHGGIRRPWVTAGDLGFGGETFLFEDQAEPLRLVSMSANGADMLRALAAKLA